MEKDKPEPRHPAPQPVPPMPLGLPTSEADRPHTTPLRHGENEPEDPLLPPEPSHDINP
jgi:hypothetical protein